MTAATVAARARALADQLGRERFTEVCVALLDGAERAAYEDELRALSAHDRVPEWGEGYWLRTWGARGLLHVWSDAATGAVVRGLADPHWRPAEMCLKVAARHEVAGTGDGAAALVDHELPRVRVQALRALAVVGDTEHADAVRRHLDDEDPVVAARAERARAAMAQRLDLRR